MADSQIKDLTESANPAPSDVLYLQGDPAGTPVDRKLQVGKLRLRSDYAAQSNAARTASFTAVAGNHYVVDLATAAADVTVTLPASAVAGDRIRVTVIDDDLTNGYAVKWSFNSHNVLADTATNPWWLFIAGESVDFIYTGNSTFGWDVVDGRIKHVASLESSSGQSVTNSTFTKITLNVEVADNAGIADPTTNNRFNIRRPGYYRVHGGLHINNMTADQRIFVVIYVGGIRRKDLGLFTTVTSGAGGGFGATDLFGLVAADTVELYVFQDDTAARNTSTDTFSRPVLTLEEG